MRTGFESAYLINWPLTTVSYFSLVIVAEGIRVVYGRGEITLHVMLQQSHYLFIDYKDFSNNGERLANLLKSGPISWKTFLNYDIHFTMVSFETLYKSYFHENMCAQRNNIYW